jgi:uncharacterized membrane protein YbaN (DUF454 family)
MRAFSSHVGAVMCGIGIIGILLNRRPGVR